MALVAFLFAVCVLFSSEAQGSTAVTPVVVKQGDDVLLEVKEHVELNEERDYFVWIFNQTYTVVKLSYDNKKKIFDKYSGRVEFSVQNRSLLLKNLQQADSGNYVAQVTGERDRIIAEYKVTVQNPVSPVQLSVNSVSNSTESCILTVSCNTERSNISSTFRCDTKACNQKGGEQSKVTSSNSSLRVYLLNESIFCNHSNQVSWTEDLKGIRDFCPLNPVTVPNRSLTIGSWIGIVVGCLVVSLCIYFCLFKGITIWQTKITRCLSWIQRWRSGEHSGILSCLERGDLSEEEKHDVDSVSQAGSTGEQEVSPNSADMEQVPV